MSEVLRDFQCKLCSKLLGSRAALQRHCKEVHSRNSTVVSCPRCQKLFQNRSNLKIHMLTHSGVRPFKCSEVECTAAFTTKQCLQFHYKKVHNYDQEQMPKIERSVAYTFDAYSGGMKVDFLEQTPRRRRKSLEDQNSILSSTMMEDSKSISDSSEENIYETLEKPGESVTSLCPNEANLPLSSTKINSINPHDFKNKNKRILRTNNAIGRTAGKESHNNRCEKVQKKQTTQISFVESFLSTSQRLTADEGNLAESQKLLSEQIESLHQSQEDNSCRHIVNIKENSSHCQNLVVSKGSKKWISNDDCPIRSVSRHETTDKLTPNRDFITRFMINDVDQSNDQHEEDESSTFLDVVDSNNPRQLSHFHESHEATSQLQINSITNPQSFINSFYNTGNPRPSVAPTSTSASMLVEAALNSVGSLIENESHGLKYPNSANLDSESNISAQMEIDHSRFGNTINNIENLENEIKMMKNSFPLPIPALPMFHNAPNNLSACNTSPNAPSSSITHNQSNNNNEIDVDSSSTNRDRRITDQEKFSSHQHTPPSPQIISPGRDYSLFTSGDGANDSVNNMSSPLHALESRRNYTANELMSPASSPSLPRYDFSETPNKGTERHELRGQNNLSTQNQLSSDDDSVLTQNNATSGEEMRLKFHASQIDLMYSKYDGPTNTAIKYINSQELDAGGFRSGTTSDVSEIQGLDMTSRSNVGSSYHPNFQLACSANSNIGLGRYHHHIYDIISEREQQQHQEISMPHQSLHNIITEQVSDQEHDQTTSVDLSRTASYAVSSPPALSYSHPHHDMLRMVSLDLTPNANMAVTNNRAFLSSQIAQHNGREPIDHHRLLSSAEQHRLLTGSNPEQHRLLVDPAAHLLMEQNNRLLGTDQSRLLGDSSQNRHMIATRSFGGYHQSTYHSTSRSMLSTANHPTANPTSYHPFPAFY